MAQDLDLNLPRIIISDPPTQREMQQVVDQQQVMQQAINNIIDRLRLSNLNV